MLQTLIDFWQNDRMMAMLVLVLIIVLPFLIYYVVDARKNHPKGLIAAALSNMGERFGYYIMNAVMVLFLASKFGISDDTAGWIYAVFLFLVYVLSLPGGVVADKLNNYKGTIVAGLLVMAAGYAMLAVPVFGADPGNVPTWILVFTCLALFVIASGNGLFKGNLQAIVGQMYDNFEAEAAKKGPEALAIAKSRRDSGFQIFYVFINIGGVIAPFIAPLLREAYLRTYGMTYEAQLPSLCHKFIDGVQMSPTEMTNLQDLSTAVTGGTPVPDLGAFATQYLEVFNTGVHYSFIASVVAMVLSLLIFLLTKKQLPNPLKKAKGENKAESRETAVAEAQETAKEIRQRMLALYAVLGIAVFFWFSFHQNAQSLSVFARDFVDTASIAPEIWQCINPFLVIILTPIIMFIFLRMVKSGHEISTPKKIAIGMLIAGLAYVFLLIVSIWMDYPSGEAFKKLAESVQSGMKVGPWVLIVTYFFLTVAELFISPLGLSFVSKIAPKHLQGICQGLWLSATAIGNLFIAVGVTMINGFSSQWMCWAVFAACCLISMGVMFGMLRWLERVTK